MSDHGPQWGEPRPGGSRWEPGPSTPNGPAWATAPAGPTPEPALWLPWYGASFIGATRRYVRKYVRFDGRASRSEFWWAYLALVIASAVVEIPYLIGIMQVEFAYVSKNLGSGGAPPTSLENPFSVYGLLFEHATPTLVVGVCLLVAFGLATILPTLALMIRRLHDLDRSGWWVLFAVVPGVNSIGAIVLLIVFCLESNPRGARFDRPPDRGEI